MIFFGSIWISKYIVGAYRSVEAIGGGYWWFSVGFGGFSVRFSGFSVVLSGFCKEYQNKSLIYEFLVVLGLHSL